MQPTIVNCNISNHLAMISYSYYSSMQLVMQYHNFFLNLTINLFLVLSKPPYEVNETGWGEFEIQIKVYFMDPIERPVRYEISHLTFVTKNNLIYFEYISPR